MGTGGENHRPGSGSDAYENKAAYFDGQTDAPWAGPDYGPQEMAKLDRVFEHTGRLMGLAVLEPGCGTGRLTEILSNLVGPSGRVVALDLSPRMVEMARRRTHKRSNVEVHLATVESFPIAHETYDLILCHQVFPHFEDKRHVLKILAASLKPQGKLMVFHFIRFAEINDRHRKAGTAVEEDTMPGDREMRDLFHEAGLDVEFIRDDTLGYFLCAGRGVRKGDEK